MDKLLTSMFRSMFIFTLSLAVFSLHSEIFSIRNCYRDVSQSERLKEELFHNTYLCYRGKLKSAKVFIGDKHE